MTHATDKFQPGEAYVAFSKIKTLDKLHIINYNKVKSMCQNMLKKR